MLSHRARSFFSHQVVKIVLQRIKWHLNQSMRKWTIVHSIPHVLPTDGNKQIYCY